MTCAGCNEPLDSTTAAFAITEFGALGEMPTGSYSICSHGCLLDLALDLRTKAIA